jgi:hypothetical protein
MAGVRGSARLRLTSRRANALGVGVVNSLELIRAGPVGLVHTHEVRIQYGKPTCVSCITSSCLQSSMGSHLTCGSNVRCWGKKQTFPRFTPTSVFGPKGDIAPARRVEQALDVAVRHEQKKRGPRRGARQDCGLSHAGDSVGGPDLRPRQRRGFGEESPPKPLGKSPNRDQAART